MVYYDMAYHTLLEYVQQAKRRGVNDQELAARLCSAGWYKVDVQDALELHTKLTAADMPGMAIPRPPAPSLLDRVAPKYYDPRAITVAALTFALALLAYFILFR